MSVCNHTSYYEIARLGFVDHEYDWRPTSDDITEFPEINVKNPIERFELSTFWLAQPTVRLQVRFQEVLTQHSYRIGYEFNSYYFF